MEVETSQDKSNRSPLMVITEISVIGPPGTVIAEIFDAELSRSIASAQPIRYQIQGFYRYQNTGIHRFCSIRKSKFWKSSLNCFFFSCSSVGLKIRRIDFCNFSFCILWIGSCFQFKNLKPYLIIFKFCYYVLSF